MSSRRDGRSLLGRDEESARLRDACAAARAGRGAIVLIAGEAGVGKTALAEDVLARSDLRRVTGRARAEAATSYGPVAAALRDRRRPVSAEADAGPLDRYLALLLPELGPAPPDADPETLIEAIVGAFVSYAKAEPAALLLEDLQWADNATLELLPRLVERIERKPLLIVGTYRSDEIGRGHPIRRLRAELRRARALHEIVLEPLAAGDVAALLARVLHGPPAPALAEVVRERTQGVPLYVEELAAALVAGSRLIRGDDGFDLVPGEDVPLPDSVRDAVLLRLDVLSAPARSLLEIAAVVGTEFSLDLITGLAGDESGTEELLEHGLIREEAPGTATFRHALVRDAVRGEIAWTRRRSLHRRIAAYLERGGAPPEVVAEHWLAANETAPARRALLQVADRACRIHAYRDAAVAGQRALDVWPEGEDEEARVAALERLAECAQASGRLADSVRALRELIESPLVRDDPRRRAAAHRSLAGALALQGAWEASLEHREEAARGFAEIGEPAESAVEWLAVCARHTAVGELDRALDAARASRRHAEESGRAERVIRAQGAEGNLLAMLGRTDEGRKLVEAALSRALADNLHDAAPEAYRRLASVLDYSSDFAGSRDAYAAAVEHCRSSGDGVTARMCLGCMSFIVFRTGEWKRALETCRDVQESPDSPAGSVLTADGIQGVIRAMRGETRGARSRLRSTLTRAEASSSVVMELISRFGLALVAEFEGDVEQAAALHDQVLEGWRSTQDRHDLVAVFLWQSTFFGRHDREEGATRRAAALATMAAGFANPETEAALAHALGEVALLRGDLDEAVRRLEQALAANEKLEIPLEQAITSWRVGVARGRRGDRGEAVRRLEAAYRITRNLGARPVAALVAADLEALGERVEKAGGGPAGLTRRQAEIVRLLAEGLTNREIAKRLFLSTRTVDMHVRNALERLDCRSRTEAARKAAELGLLG
jgi:DNA-binding CsgD family transcriptional regulator